MAEFESQLGRRLPGVRTGRRHFLKLSAGALSGLMLSNCRRGLSDVQAGGDGRSDLLEIYSWAAYTDDEVIRAFQDQTGIEVRVTLYDSNETMLAKLQAGGGGSFSIVYPSDYAVQEMLSLEMLAPLDKSQIQGLDNLLPNWVNPGYDPDNAHSVPFAWGTTGLVYNRQSLNPPPTDWDYLWQSRADLTRQVTLLNDVREVMGAALKSLGYSYNSTNPQEIEAAYQRLVEIRPTLASFTTDAWQDQILAGDLAVAMGYSSDAIAVREDDPDLVYIVPDSGASLWTDTMAILKTAPNPEAAYAWINFQLDPQNAARNVEKFNFATPVRPAIELLPPELQANQNLFPSEEVLSRCESIAPVGDAVDLYDRYWTMLTSA
ncbi:MAG: spermidine/putrescine ABC transporter substrate-binding protein [Cyanobacteria bacterium Co-bin8]|nr:spermidine/putrescine ABC transporter substrate-binding protein [Cyanobacteria bacterium Co-bin8]